MKLPAELLDSLNGIKGFDRDAFIKVHEQPESITSIRINPLKQSRIPNPESRIPWSEFGYYLDTRPSFTYDPLFHAGTYYVQEASSMFLEQAISQLIDLEKPNKILDLSAAPGGKSTHILSLIGNNSLLVSNEVIRSRAQVLKDNIVKWGHENVVVTQNDPRDFNRLGNYFDVILVDAPCSGSGLFRRDPTAIGEWSLNNVALCSQRQQRILADAWLSLKQDGWLIYSTCSYSADEDEVILDWLCREFPLESARLKVKKEWKITEVKTTAGMYAYRFWPDKLKGEGFFLACLKKTGHEQEPPVIKPKKPVSLTAQQSALMQQWINVKDLEIFLQGKNVYAWTSSLASEFGFLLERLHFIYSGVMLGEFARNKFIPSHELSMTDLVRENIPRIPLTNEDAIRYLRRQEMNMQVETTGWQLVTYEGFNLGWVNVLSNRINNYYPKSLRILK